MNSLVQIDHIGVAVRSIDQAIKPYLLLTDAISYSLEEVASQKVKVAFIEIGNQKIELLEPLQEDGPIQKFLDRQGEGMHHLAFKVVDIKASLAEMKRKGFKLIDEDPRMGAGNKWIAFLHPKDTHGVLIELCQPRKQNN